MIIAKYHKSEIYCNFYGCECGCKYIRENFKFCPKCGKLITNMEDAKRFEELDSWTIYEEGEKK